MSISNSHKNNPEFFKPDLNSKGGIPYVDQGVSAGFPSPALDFMENTINLNTDLCEHPEATFLIKVKGHSMIDAGLNDHDILIVDRGIIPENKKIAVCLIDGEFTVKRIRLEKGELWLIPENPKYSPIKVTEENRFMVWGIVTYVIKKL